MLSYLKYKLSIYLTVIHIQYYFDFLLTVRLQMEEFNEEEESLHSGIETKIVDIEIE
jgi:hypothetical protein